MLAVNQKLFYAFVDLEKAFDRVSGGSEIMGHTTPVQCERTLAAGCLSLYRGHSACVQVAADMSSWFDVQSGVKQRYTMSAWMFNLYLDSSLQGVKQGDLGVEVGDLNVNCLLYTDNAVLIVSSDCEFQALSPL